MIGIITQEVGHTDRDGNAVSKRVLAYMQAAGVAWPADQPPPYWGGGLLAWAAIRQGLTPPVDAMNAESWRSWGHPIASPETGCIAIMTGRPTQVGTVIRMAGDKVYVIHPRNGEVGTEVVSADRIIECRRPPAGGIQQAQPASQAITVSIEREPTVQATPLVPKNTIEHLPTQDESTNELVRSLLQRLGEMERSQGVLERQLMEHGHEFVRSDGTSIPFDDIALASEVQRALDKLRAA